MFCKLHSHTMGKCCKEGPFVFHLLALPTWKDSLIINVFKNPLQLVHWVVLNWKEEKTSINNFVFQMHLMLKHSAVA